MDSISTRLIPATILALTVHIGLLSARISNNQTIIPPKPQAVQRIAVSLGSVPAERRQEQKPEPVSEPAAEPVPEPRPHPEPQVQQKKEIKSTEKPPAGSLPGPKPKKIHKRLPAPTIKPGHARKARVTPRIAKANPPEDTAKEKKQKIKQPSAQATVLTGEDITPGETAARVIQEASPIYQVNPPPKYPRLARRRGYEGVVILDVLVRRTGSVETIRVVKSSGYSILDRAALNAVFHWQFKPGTVDGAAQNMHVKVPVRFRLKES